MSVYEYDNLWFSESQFVHPGVKRQQEKEKFERLGYDIGRLVASKQLQYGDSFNKAGKVLAILYPDGISVEQMTDALCVVRIIDKLFRIASYKDSEESPYKDIAVYALLGARRHE